MDSQVRMERYITLWREESEFVEGVIFSQRVVGQGRQMDPSFERGKGGSERTICSDKIPVDVQQMLRASICIPAFVNRMCNDALQTRFRIFITFNGSWQRKTAFELSSGVLHIMLPWSIIQTIAMHISYQSFHLLIGILNSFCNALCSFWRTAAKTRHLQLLGVFICHKRAKSLLEIIHRQLLTSPLLQPSVNCLGRDENAVDDLNDAIGSNAILNRDAGKSIDFDADETSVTSYVNAKRLVFKEGGKINLCNQVSPAFFIICVVRAL